MHEVPSGPRSIIQHRVIALVNGLSFVLLFDINCLVISIRLSALFAINYEIHLISLPVLLCVVNIIVCSTDNAFVPVNVYTATELSP